MEQPKKAYRVKIAKAPSNKPKEALEPAIAKTLFYQAQGALSAKFELNWWFILLETLGGLAPRS